MRLRRNAGRPGLLDSCPSSGPSEFQGPEFAVRNRLPSELTEYVPARLVREPGNLSGEPCLPIAAAASGSRNRCGCHNVPADGLGIFGVLAVVLLLSGGVTFFSTNSNQVAAASDVLQTCLGFFIGVATGYA